MTRRPETARLLSTTRGGVSVVDARVLLSQSKIQMAIKALNEKVWLKASTNGKTS